MTGYVDSVTVISAESGIGELSSNHQAGSFCIPFLYKRDINRDPSLHEGW